MDWPLLFDLLGVFFFAISGSLLAAKRGYDVVASLLLGSFTGLGGGIIRDLVLGVPPATFARPIHMLPPLIAVVVVYFMMRHVERFQRVLLVFDAAGLALFCTTGAITALLAGMNPYGAAVLGVVTGVGGGLLRDVVANRDPQLFNPNDLYAVPAMLGAIAVTALWTFGVFNVFTHVAVAVAVFAFRMLSLKFKWRVPHAASKRWSRGEGEA